MTELRAWLAARTPPPPAGFSWTLGREAGSQTESLAGAGLAELEAALAGSGERRGAFHLLAADALVTYACERAAESEDPDGDLLRLVRMVAGAR